MGNTSANNYEDSSSQVKDSEDKKLLQNKKAGASKKPPTDGAQAGGWFGGIFSKLSIKPKNQMILPDDKNPTVSRIIEALISSW